MAKSINDIYNEIRLAARIKDQTESDDKKAVLKKLAKYYLDMSDAEWPEHPAAMNEDETEVNECKGFIEANINQVLAVIWKQALVKTNGPKISLC